MQKKYIVYIVTSIIILALLIIGNQKDNPKKNLEVINSAYETLINPIAEIEYVRLTSEDGSYEEIYQDSQTGITQTDRYDKNNDLQFRNIFDKDGGKSTIISKENGKYEGSIENLAPEIVKENKELPVLPLIELMHNNTGSKYLRGEFKLNKSSSINSFVYESKYAKVYIDKESKIITKIENIDHNGKTKSIEYAKLKKGEKDLFNINSKNNSNIDLSNVKLKEYTQEFDGDITNAVG